MKMAEEVELLESGIRDLEIHSDPVNVEMLEEAEEGPTFSIEIAKGLEESSEFEAVFTYITKESDLELGTHEVKARIVGRFACERGTLREELMTPVGAKCIKLLWKKHMQEVRLAVNATLGQSASFNPSEPETLPDVPLSPMWEEEATPCQESEADKLN